MGKAKTKEQAAEKATTVTALDITCTPYLGTPSLSSALYTAQVRVGDATSSGLWEQILNTTTGNHSWSTSAGYLDTGDRDAELVVEKTAGGSQALWTVDSNTITVPKTTTLTKITNVAVRGEVATHPQQVGSYGNVRIEWAGVTVTFYNDAGTESHTIPEPFDSDCSPIVDLLDSFRSTGPRPPRRREAMASMTDERPEQEEGKGTQTAMILKSGSRLFTPPGTNNFVATRVVLSGTVRLLSEDPNRQAPPNLGANQIIGKVFVWIV
jgi:hypothetical protein